MVKIIMKNIHCYGQTLILLASLTKTDSFCTGTAVAVLVSSGSSSDSGNRESRASESTTGSSVADSITGSVSVALMTKTKK